MYMDCVACCPLVSHVEYAPRALSRLGNMGQTDASIHFTLNERRGQRNKKAYLEATLCHGPLLPDSNKRNEFQLSSMKMAHLLKTPQT